MWGGRFKGGADPQFAEFNSSFGFDRRLFEVDVHASIAWCAALDRAGVLTATEASQIRHGLEQVLVAGIPAESKAEDVHSFVESRGVELVGDVGRKLHTARSRNDQVATDFRIWIREALDQLHGSIREAQSALVEFAEESLREGTSASQSRAVVLPGYTHLQRAQPVLLAHWCLAYFEMLKRDRERLADTRRRVNVLPLGSAAVAGTSFPIDRETLAAALGFDSVARNSLDAVSDRDFCVEFLGDCALLMAHLSRLAEDVILYATSEFGFVELSDAIATGSSLMPQKKNPDSMELVRGKAGRVFGDLLGVLTMLKGLPLAYNKDMQEDKEAVFDAFDTVSACLQVTSTVLRNITVNKERALAAAATGYMNATELADYLVRKGMPFRDAHEMVGKVVMRAIQLGQELHELSISELREFSTLIAEDVHVALSLEQTLKSKSQTGGTSPAAVANALTEAHEYLKE
jgi:argininosuccinate lyase